MKPVDKICSDEPVSVPAQDVDCQPQEEKPCDPVVVDDTRTCLLMTKGNCYKRFVIEQTGENEICFTRDSNTSQSKPLTHKLDKCHVVEMPPMREDGKDALFPIKLYFTDKSSRKLYFKSEFYR